MTGHAHPDRAVPTEAPGRVQELIFRQALRFPKQIETNRQRARCFVPRRIAKLIHMDRQVNSRGRPIRPPSQFFGFLLFFEIKRKVECELPMQVERRPYVVQMVAPAVEAFYERDPHSMKAASFLANVKEMGDFVEAPVQFTRCLYAMIAQQVELCACVCFEEKKTEKQCCVFRHQDFHAPRGWPAPFNKSKRSHNLGLKLTYGFEILLTGGGRKFNREAQLSSFETWVVRQRKIKLYSLYCM